MDISKRQSIFVVNDNEGSVIGLSEMGSSNSKNFLIKKCIGTGTSCMVYLASYQSGGMEHNCLIKELYPYDCGLYRDNGGTILKFNEENPEQVNEWHNRYDKEKEKYIRAYKIQLEFQQGSGRVDEENNNYEDIYNTDDKMLLSLGISVPRGLYENKYGILYTVYDYTYGTNYKKYGTDKFSVKESLHDILDIIIQTAMMIDAFHRKGYIVLDIKEDNILIAGNKYYRTAELFDFGSLVVKEQLKDFSFERDAVISFTSTDPDLLLPPELANIERYFNEGNLQFAKSIVKRRLAVNGEKTDMFLLAAILFKRIFGIRVPEYYNNDNNKSWKMPPESDYIKIPQLRDKLYHIFSRTLCKKVDNRYTMPEFIKELCELRTVSFLEDPEEFKKYTELCTGVSKGYLQECSRNQWEQLSGSNGKFSQLIKFTERFDSKVSLEDENENQIMPNEVISQNHHALLIGDGGMGKSTSIFDYWTGQLSQNVNSSQVCLYIDLSHYSSIHKATYEDSLLNGQVRSDMSIDLLTYMEVNILQAFGIFDNFMRTTDVLKNTEAFKQMTALDKLLSEDTEKPQFVIFMDGYNEILDKLDRNSFEFELEKAISKWKNTSIIVTSRIMSDFDDDNNVFNKLETYKFKGISDNDVELALKENKSLDTAQLDHLKQDRIWEVLKIPMFLNMFLALHTDNNVSIHTRGELLDNFVMQREKETSERISKSSKERNTSHANVRNFLVLYSLPFFANKLDCEKSYYCEECDFFKKIKSGIKLYYHSDEVKYKYAKVYSLPNVDDEDLLNILITETGYCICTNNNEKGFSHQYFRDYFAAKHIQNILSAAQAMASDDFDSDRQLDFINENGLDYTWSNDVCILLGEIIGDYKNEPGYEE